jgi:HemK-related putative methylase
MNAQRQPDLRTDAPPRSAFGLGSLGPFTLVCPQCRGPLEWLDADTLGCPIDQHTFQRRDGIWSMLSRERAAYFGPFMRDYETIRRAEARGSDNPDYYRNLPFSDLTGAFSEDWRIRATSYRTLLERVVQPLERQLGRPLQILDIGAGNGWLAHRLARRGHDVAAVDLLTNAFDGLGAHIHYETPFTPVQAEFDRLPFATGSVDLVVFNGALHYSTSYQTTLSEALRVLQPAGRLAVLDSPVYRHAASGDAMVREREAEFVRRYGFASNAIPSENYLTYRRLDELAATLGLEWRLSEPFYGLEWSLRPWRAKLRRRREPAKFLLIVSEPVGAPKRLPRTLTVGLARAGLRWRYRLTQRHRYKRLVLEKVAGKPLLVLPRVFHPKLFRSSEFLVRFLAETPIRPGAQVLDMGSGSGVGAVMAAARGCRVTAVDINADAVRCTRINALLNELEACIDVRHGDLFVPVTDERFDIVLFNPPYFRGEAREPLEHAWRSVDTVERFAAELADHLTPAGYALVVLSSDGELSAFLQTFRDNGLGVTAVARRNLLNETLTIYRLSARE